MSATLCSGVFLDNNQKKCWIDPKTDCNSFMLFARGLSITWGDDTRYWKWIYSRETSNMLIEVAELIKVWWLEVGGKFDTSNLPLGVTYEVAFVVMLTNAAAGWVAPVKLELLLPDGTKQEKTEELLSKPKNQWLHIVVGEFETCEDMKGDMKFSLRETNDNFEKSGLVVKGVIIQPKCSTINIVQNDKVIIAKDLSIIWGDDQRYWSWSCLNETSNTLVEIAELKDVCWLEVQGMFNISKLSPETMYEVAFVVMLKDPAHGWKIPVNLRLVLPDGEKQERKECLFDKPKGQWMELKIGEFKKGTRNAGEIQFSLFETESNQWKKGLVLKNVVIRPKECWIDPKKAYNSFMLFARGLSITWGDDTRYWKWIYSQETSNVLVEVAELIEVWWLEVSGKFDTSNLPPGVTYEVAFVLMLKNAANGWAVPVKLGLILPDGTKQEKTEDLQSKPKDQWLHIVVGELETCEGMKGDMQFSLRETNDKIRKSGLILKSVVIRPKN